MPFEKGNKHSKGRVEGSVNKTTASAKQAFQQAFDRLGGFEALVRWAQDKENPQNRTTFYTLYARLIPTEVASDPNAPLNITITRHVIAERS